MKLIVIIPTYNERDNIIQILDRLHEVMKKVHSYKISYLIVDDNSPDGTTDAVYAYTNKHYDTYCITGKKEGLGKALLRGLSYGVGTLHADRIIQMDADLSHDPAVIPKFLEAFRKGSDFVVGSRYIPGGSIPEHWGIHRKIYSIVGNTIVRYGLGRLEVHDWTGGYRAYDKKYYERAKEGMQKYGGYVFQIAFLYKALVNGACISEVPIHFTDRMFGRSKIAPTEYIIDILSYIFTTRIRTLFTGSFIKFLVVGLVGFIINAVVLVVLHDWAKFPAAVANFIGALLAIFSNYNLNNIWTFRTHTISGLKRYIVKMVHFYVTSIFGVVVIQTGIIAFGVFLFSDTHYFIYFLIGTVCLLIWNYNMYSRVIWKKTIDQH